MVPLNLSSAHETNYKLVFPYLPFLQSGVDSEKGDSVLLYCKTVNLPRVGIDLTIIPSQFIIFKEPSKDISYDNLVVTFAVDELFVNYKFIYNWITYAKHPEKFEIKRSNVDVSLHILSNKKNPKANILFKNLFPIELSEIPMTYMSDNSDDLIATATFAFNYFLME